MEFARDVLGIEPLPWQRWLLIHVGELDGLGLFRFRTVLILVARQNGKTTIVEVKNLWKMFVLGVALVIGTAQNLDISEESWDKAVEIVESIPELAAEVKHVDKTNGKKALKLTSGSRWKIAAASRKGGRGLSGDDVNLDELREHQNWAAWGAVTKTTMARPNAQVFAFSNAGDDKSVVLNSLRENAMAALKDPANADRSLGIFEWSAPDHIRCTCPDRSDGRPHRADCLLRDRKAWAQANPSLGYTITEQAIEASLATDPEPVFRTEVLCQRVPDLEEGIITTAQWSRIADAASRREGDLAIGVDVSMLRDWAAITVYGTRADNLGHAQLVDYRPGVDWLVERLADLKTALDPIAIGMGRGTYESLKEDLDQHGIRVPENPEEPGRGDLAVMNAAGMAAACSQLIDAVRQESFRQVPSPQLDEAVTGAKTQQRGDTIAWHRRISNAEISPVASLTAARWAYVTRLALVNRKKTETVPLVAWR